MDEDQVVRAARFHEAMLAGCDEAWRACRYNPTYFRRMVLELGGVTAVQRLLASPEEFHEGLTRLWECKRLDLSVENWVLHPAWAPLFTDAEQAIAHRRLASVGYEPTHPPS